MRSFALVASLASLVSLCRLAHAIPTGTGDSTSDPLPDCTSQVTGRLTASPSTVAPGGSTTLSWSVRAPARCPAFRGVRVASQAVGRSGSLVVQPGNTTRYTLDAVLAGGLVPLDAVQVTVSFVTVSGTLAADVAEFDRQWMQLGQDTTAWRKARDTMLAHNGNVWEISVRMRALLRMFELTRDRKYLEQAYAFTELVTSLREDQRTSGAEADQFRGRIVPGWASAGITEADMFRVDEVTASVYSYPVAAFARIVAEDPALQADYGRDAVRYANLVTDTAWLFAAQLKDRPSGPYHESWLAQLDVYATMLTEQKCGDAYNRMITEYPNDGPAAFARWAAQRKICNDLRRGAGTSLAHNENLAFLMMLMELHRALDSDLYRQSAARTTGGELLRTFIPAVVARTHRFFMRHVHPDGTRNRWNHLDETPLGTHAEDSGHAALDMRYHEMLRRDFTRLNAASTAAGEPIPFDPIDTGRFARTFLDKVGAGFDFSENVEGGDAKPGFNTECDGWISLTVADPAVWQVCRDKTLRIVGGQQPYLEIGNHAALLYSKRYLPWRPPGDRVPMDGPSG